MLAIEQDLVRWSRRQWIVAVAAVLALQFALLFASARTPVQSRSVYPTEPTFVFTSGPLDREQSEWLKLQDPLLFAGANQNGFSGLAWMEPRRVELPAMWQIPAPQFLTLGQARPIGGFSPETQAFPVPQHTRPPSSILLPSGPPTPDVRNSRLIVESAEGRRLRRELELPHQFHSDVVTSSVVQVMLAPEGFVLSARLLNSSGLRKADQDALALAQSALFEPAFEDSSSGENFPRRIALAKLIFEWHTLDLSQTNSVTR